MVLVDPHGSPLLSVKLLKRKEKGTWVLGPPHAPHLLVLDSKVTSGTLES